MPDTLSLKLDVMQALARYTLAVDSDDRDTYLACFDPDASLGYEGPDGVSTLHVTGHRAIGRIFDAQMAHKRGRTRHLAGMPYFDAVEVGSVRTRTPFVVTLAVEREVRTFASGHYRDTWVVDERGARLRERVVVLDAPLS